MKDMRMPPLFYIEVSLLADIRQDGMIFSGRQA